MMLNNYFHGGNDEIGEVHTFEQKSSSVTGFSLLLETRRA